MTLAARLIRKCSSQPETSVVSISSHWSPVTAGSNLLMIAGTRLVKTHAGRQQDAERDGYIHVEPTTGERP